MVSPEKIKEVIIAGINKFVKPYNVAAEEIQLVFKLDEKGEVKYYTCINHQIKNTVSLKDLRGNDITNIVVSRHLKKLLKKFAADNNVPEAAINLMTGLNKGDNSTIFILLRNLTENIRLIKDAGELK